MNARRTRGGPFILNPPGIDWDTHLDSDPQKPWIVGLGLHGDHYARDRQRSWWVAPSVEWRSSARLSVRLEPRRERLRTTAQYVGTFELGDGLGRLVSAPGENVFLVKLSYWWRP